MGHAAFSSKVCGAVTGAFVGDALAMPVHWYYDRVALQRDYGVVDRYLPPRNPHPNSILWRSTYSALNEQGEILHDQAKYWGRPDVHYHQFLKAGENTVNLQVLRLALQLARTETEYSPEVYARSYVDFMREPGSHNDTYLEEFHRGFFRNYALEIDLMECGIVEKHIGGLAPVVPLYLTLLETRPERTRDREGTRELVRRHVAVTHRGEAVAAGVDLLLDIADQVISGVSLRDAIEARVERQDSPFVSFPLVRWLAEDDLRVIGTHLSPACYLEDALPAVLYLALKYHAAPRAGLIANTMAGGDNAYRGAALGALLGLENGLEGWPSEWVEGLSFADVARYGMAPEQAG